jgi:hypothetical protein
MHSHYHFTAVLRALPAPADGADTVNPSRRATGHSVMMWFIPLCILMLILTPLQGVALWISTTDGEPAAECSQIELVTGARCEGDHCDDVSIHCADVNFVPVWVDEWQPFIEDEGEMICPKGFITGLMCTGDDCSNISVQCRDGHIIHKLTGHRYIRNDAKCVWTGKLSEENYELLFSHEEYPVGIRCDGDYCDDLSFQVCEIADQD